MPDDAMFWRAVLAFLILPGMVAFVIPLLVIRPIADSDSFSMIGVVPVLIGLTLLLWCVRDFYVAGKGTLAPWAPPKNLVVVGLYRFSRNPMYIAVISILLGWALSFRSWALWIYAIAVALAFHLRVVLNEEPFLARTHGEAWLQYKSRVARWLF
jgi:protein-S-isoprenylcysteine O-methyltransferase Ste14